MHQGQVVFAQLMRHLPLTTFRRCVARYAGEHKVKSFSCLDQYLCMAFAQLTYRESLRDIESSLRAQAAKLYHLGIRGYVSRNTLANANATRDWRIYASFAERLIGIARGLYAEEPFGVDLAQTVYALDATTIDLCLSVFPWAPFRSTKAAVKLHTLPVSPMGCKTKQASSCTSYRRAIRNRSPAREWKRYRTTTSAWRICWVVCRPFVQMDQAAPPDQSVLRNFRKRGEDTNLDRHLSLRPRRHCQEAAEPAAVAL
jgi:hypothetical protein